MSEEFDIPISAPFHPGLPTTQSRGVSNLLFINMEIRLRFSTDITLGLANRWGMVVEVSLSSLSYRAVLLQSDATTT